MHPNTRSYSLIVKIHRDFKLFFCRQVTINLLHSEQVKVIQKQICDLLPDTIKSTTMLYNLTEFINVHVNSSACMPSAVIPTN